jgi:menaquinone-dependent protoporphyrinogen oxidase
MKKVLIAYMSRSGSTREVAEFMQKELQSHGHQVDVRPIKEVDDFSGYDVVIAGGMLYRFGWHEAIVKFLNKYMGELQKKKVALFVTGLGLVKTEMVDKAGYPVYIDPTMLNQPANPQKLGFWEKQSVMESYLRLVLRTIERIKPVSLGFFSGKLDYSTLSFGEKLIMRLLASMTSIKSGDHRNWDAIREWVKSLAIK